MITIHPNWHAAFIHFPIGLLSIGVLIELFSFLWPRGSFRTAGRWMIGLGALLCIPAVTTGLYAFASVVGGTDDMTWAARKAASSLSGAQWHLIVEHLWWNVGGTAAFIIAVIVWIGSSNHWRDKLHWPLLVLVLIGMACLISGSWHGGEMVYAHGVAVTPAGKATIAAASAKTASHEGGDEAEKLKQEIDPLQVHTLLAGFLFALAAGSLGLSYRSLAELRSAQLQGIDLDDAQHAGGYQGVPEHDERIIDALRGEEGVVIRPPQTPPARFWLLTVLVGIPTAISGLCVAEALSWQRITEEFNGAQRDAAHMVLGAGIIVLALILAAVTRWARRSGILLSLFSLLLIIAVAGQIWLGVLLTFDSMHGPLTRFAPASTATVESHGP